MSIGSVYSAGLQGVQRGLQGLQANADAIAKIGTDDGPNSLGEVANEVVGLKENEFQVKASTVALKAADGALGSLIDVIA